LKVSITIESLGDDISKNQLKYYIAYKKVQNLVCVELYKKQILLHLKLNPDTVELKDDYIVDVRNIGHYGTGNLRIIIRNAKDFDNAKMLIERAYNEA